MKIPANDSPFWEIAFVIGLGAVAALLLEVNYRHGFQANVDIPTIIGIVVTAGGFFGAKRVIKNRSKKCSSDESQGDG